MHPPVSAFQSIAPTEASAEKRMRLSVGGWGIELRTVVRAPTSALAALLFFGTLRCHVPPAVTEHFTCKGDAHRARYVSHPSSVSRFIWSSIRANFLCARIAPLTSSASSFMFLSVVFSIRKNNTFSPMESGKK